MSKFLFFWYPAGDLPSIPSLSEIFFKFITVIAHRKNLWPIVLLLFYAITYCSDLFWSHDQNESNDNISAHSGRMRNDYPIRNNNFIIWINDFDLFKIKTSFFKKLYPKGLFIMPGTNYVFLPRRIARHHVCAGIFKLPTWKTDVTWKKKIIQIIEKYRLVDKNLREGLELGNANICEMHYDKDDIEFTSKLQNKSSYFFHAYCFG